MIPRRRDVLLPLACVFVLPACTGAPTVSGSAAPSGSAEIIAPSFPPEPMDAAMLTAYDPALPIDLRDEAEPRDEDGVTVRDVSWLSPYGGRVSAWLVVPHGEGPFAGLVFLHGSETWRDDFLDEALAMAHGGAASIVLDAPFARMGDDRHHALSDFADPEDERAMTAQAIVDVRRAYDVLAARDDIDPQRLGFVGHSWGASLGAVLAAVDPRPTSLVLIAGRPSWTGFLAASEEDWVARERGRTGAEAWDLYLRLMAPLDAMAVIGNVDATRLYLQYGTADAVVPEDVSAELINAAVGARADLYEAGHALDNAATADRTAWLVDRLDLELIPAAVLDGVGLPDR